jgi:hypothetical protein
LNQADDCPREVKADHDVGVLEILTFGKHIGGDDHAEFVIWLDIISLVVADRTKAVNGAGGALTLPRYAFEFGNTPALELACEVGNRIGELAEHNNLLSGVSLAQELMQSCEFSILRSVPSAMMLENFADGIAVSLKVLR